jgi:hypothetical protein
MNNQNENKRLVLIGIRRKGEKGFKTRVDSNISLNQSTNEDASLDISVSPHSNSSQILNLLPE